MKARAGARVDFRRFLRHRAASIVSPQFGIDENEGWVFDVE
jgi:hypothetical protein